MCEYCSGTCTGTVNFGMSIFDMSNFDVWNFRHVKILLDFYGCTRVLEYRSRQLGSDMKDETIFLKKNIITPTA
jgi:hypothetical protein